MFRPMQSSSEGEGETPCGSDQGLEQLTDVSGSNVEVYAEEEVNVSEVKVCVCVCACVHACVRVCVSLSFEWTAVHVTAVCRP